MFYLEEFLRLQAQGAASQATLKDMLWRGGERARVYKNFAAKGRLSEG